MSHRPTRYLAPLALFAAVLTVFLVTRSELGGSEAASSAPTPSTRSTTATARKKKGATTSKGSAKAASGTTATSGSSAKTYTVQSGDVLGAISEKTGVAVDDLLDYNDIDAQNLRVGQKLKLTP